VKTINYRFNSLEDFLISSTSTVDGQLDDGWGALFRVKGREIAATVLFSDIAGFSRRTLDLNPTETLIFVNNFFSWISAEALRESKGIVDKYIGDELMIVFSKEFGSDDPFREAIQAARWMAEHDALSFSPHMGIASGRVIVGYVGTPLRYNCSVFGSAVALAARCAGVRPDPIDDRMFSSTITFPACEWGARDFTEMLPPEKYKHPDGSVRTQPHSWELREPRVVNLKNLPDHEVRELVKRSVHLPQQSAEERAREALESLRQAGRYWPDRDA